MEASRKQIARPRFLPGLGRPVGLSPEMSRHGTIMWYYRIGHGQRTPMKDASGKWLEFGSPAFCELYRKLHFGGYHAAPALKVVGRRDENSLEWLIEKYLRWLANQNKAKNTQKQHRTILQAIARKNGSEPYRRIEWRHVKELRDQIAERGSDEANPKPAPAMANRVVSTLGVLFDWAIKEEKLLERNPCAGITKVDYKKTSHHCWTDAECDAFEAAYPPGTREHLAYALLMYTGQRRSDVVRMGPQHVDQDGYMTIIQQKTGKEVTVPMLPVVQRAIAAGPCGTQTFIGSVLDGSPITAGSFGNWLSEACDSIGLSECTAHGLRHTAATRALENGADVDYLMAVFGFTLQVAARYVQHAKLAQAAKRGAHHLERRPSLRLVAKTA